MQRTFPMSKNKSKKLANRWNHLGRIREIHGCISELKTLENLEKYINNRFKHGKVNSLIMKDIKEVISAFQLSFTWPDRRMSEEEYKLVFKTKIEAIKVENGFKLKITYLK